MNLSKKKFIMRGSLVLLSMCASIYLALFVVESYFFDKIIYYKSTYFGYLIPNQPTDYSKFGRRSQDIVDLFKTINKNPELIFQQCRESRSKPDDKLTIAFIGDSYVWGQGLKNNQRVAYLLERELSKKRETTVLSYGFPGDSLLDNYIKYVYLEAYRSDIDLYVFGMVNNDLLIRERDLYSERISLFMQDLCYGKTYFQQKYDPYFAQEISHDEQLRHSYSEDYKNICVARKIASLLPKNAIYFDFNGYYDSTYLKVYTDILVQSDLSVTSTKDLVTEYELKNGLVSPKDGHPSSTMNKAYTRILVKEIENKIAGMRI